MSGPISDPALLFAPTKPSSIISIQSRSSSPPKFYPSPKFYISPPSLSPHEKAKYKKVTLPNRVEFDPEELDQIIGEGVVEKTLFYFVRFRDGVAHKVRTSVACLTRILMYFTRLGHLSFLPRHLRRTMIVLLRIMVSTCPSAFAMSDTLSNINTARA
jgi:hypothetical protein